MIEQGPEWEQAKERVKTIEEMNIPPYAKVELVLTILGEKPVSEITISPYTDSSESVLTELKRIGLSAKLKVERGQSIIIAASTPKTLEQIQTLDPQTDHQLFGRLMGFPETAVQAFIEGTLLEDDEPVRDDPINIIQMSVSQTHWQQELEHMRKLSLLVKELSPKIYRDLKGDHTP